MDEPVVPDGVEDPLPLRDQAGAVIPDRLQADWRPGWRVGNSKARTRRVSDARADVDRIAELAREEGYQRTLDELLPAIVDQDRRLSVLTDQILEASASELREYVPLLKVLLAERKLWVDRKFGSATQRASVESRSVSASVDLNELIRLERERW